MDCELIALDLVAYHFGVIDEDARASVESHLLVCPSCLRDYLAIKRSTETSEARPRPSAKERLRKAVAREVGAEEAGAWSWWERPLALALASAALVTAVVVVQGVESSSEAPHAWSAGR